MRAKRILHRDRELPREPPSIAAPRRSSGCFGGLFSKGGGSSPKGRQPTSPDVAGGAKEASSVAQLPGSTGGHTRWLGEERDDQEQIEGNEEDEDESLVPTDLPVVEPALAPGLQRRRMSLVQTGSVAEAMRSNPDC